MKVAEHIGHSANLALPTADRTSHEGATLSLDDAIFINVGGEELGSDDKGNMYVKTGQGDYSPLQPGIVLNVRGQDDQGEFRSTHYIDENLQLRDLLEFEDGTPYYPNVVTSRWDEINRAKGAAQERLDSPPSLAPIHEAWVIDHDPDEPTHASLIPPAVGRARPVLPRDMPFTESDQRQLNRILNEEDVIQEAERIIADASSEIGSGTTRAERRREGESSRRRLVDTAIAVGSSLVGGRQIRRTRTTPTRGGRHSTSRASGSSTQQNRVLV